MLKSNTIGKLKTKFLMLLSIFFCANGYPQFQFNIVLKIDQKCNDIEIDDVNNIYLVDGASLFMYSIEGNKLKTFSNNIYGTISSLSFNTSLKPTLFFKDLGYLVQLDNTLSEQGGYKVLQNYGIDAASLLTASAENSFWIFDERNMKLKNINRSFVTLLQSNNLSQISAEPLRPIQLEENDNFIYLNNPTSGVLVFDTYGSYIKTIPILNIEDFCVYNEGIFYVKKGFVNRFGLLDLIDERIEFPLVGIEKIRINKNIILIKDKDSATILKDTSKK